jgi:hypothetical protein
MLFFSCSRSNCRLRDAHLALFRNPITLRESRSFHDANDPNLGEAYPVGISDCHMSCWFDPNCAWTLFHENCVYLRCIPSQ